MATITDEKPIIFSTRLVQEIQSGNKTQTRRVVTTKNCPYGEVGTILWVRETFRRVRMIYGPKEFKYEYRADYDKVFANLYTWKPSIHMPRKAARIFLEVTEIRKETLLDITEEEAVREGLKDRDEFLKLWDIINAKRGYTVNTNPEVWVVGFKVLIEV